ncbi:hypothetical protein ACFSVK_05230 [Azorhizophilus paspali]|uniref:hypothetical protein n=1 Tax=Azorhizophilus paspali TaxID=69963 RepID=UPI003637862F
MVGFSDAWFYTRYPTFSDMIVPGAKRLKNFELESSLLEKLLTEAQLDNIESPNGVKRVSQAVSISV